MWTWFKDIIFACIQFFQVTLGDWGLAIIIITIIIRLALTPLTARQYKASYNMTKMQPLIQDLQQKYGDDQKRLQEEMSKIYADNKYSPLAGCLPLVIQMPIFIALYQVLLEYIPVGATFYGMIGNLAASPSTVFAESGFVACVPYLVLMVLFALSMIFPMMMQPNNNSMTKVMTFIMVIMMCWFGWAAPAGVILFWDASAYIGLGQQFFIRKKLKHQDEEEAEETIDITPVQVDVVRREHKPRPKKKH